MSETGRMARAKKPEDRRDDTELKFAFVRALINKGRTNGEIKKACVKQFGCASRTAGDWINTVIAEMRADLGTDPIDRKAVSHSRWLSIYANEKAPLAVRCRALENLDKIEGNHAPVKQALTDTAGQDVTPERRLTIAELDQELAKFAAEPEPE